MNEIFLEIDGKQVNLTEILSKATSEQLNAMGFPIENGQFKMAPIEVKTDAMVKQEGIEEAANFIKSVVLPASHYKEYGVKQINTGTGSFGYTVPTVLADAILEKKAKFNVLSERAFTFQLAGNFDLPVEGDSITGYWVGEVDDDDANLVTESEPSTTRKSLTDRYVAALVKASWKLLNTSAFNIVNYVATLAGRKLAEACESAYIAGNGTTQPKGIRLETLSQAVAQAGDGLAYQDIINLYFSLKPQYRKNAVFITSTMGAKAIHGLKDTQDRPIFQPGMPLDSLFNKPLLESVDIPENLGTGTNTTEIYFGDASYYWIKTGQAIEMATQDVIERLQTKILVYESVDGALTLTEAFTKLTGVKEATES